MRLRVIKRLRWMVLAAVDERGECAVAEFLSRLDEGTAEARQIQALIARVATNGPPLNEKRSRRLEGAIYELKTRSGIRIPYFYDEGRIVVCTEALRKPKKAELRRVIERAMRIRAEYRAAKLRGDLEILEEDE